MKTLVREPEELLHKLSHYLPAQFPLKDFVHHNTLHAYQNLPFHRAMKQAAEQFGYQTYLGLDEYREKYQNGKISDAVLNRAIALWTDNSSIGDWREKLILKKYDMEVQPKVGRLRALWKSHFRINLDKEVYPLLFRTVGNYLDQGVALWSMPQNTEGFMATVLALDKQSSRSFFRTKAVRELAQKPGLTLNDLLGRIVGDKLFFEQYLFDSQFAHPGWSGMVNVAEESPDFLLRHRKISLHDFIVFELLLELDVLESKLGEKFLPLAEAYELETIHLMDESELNEKDLVRIIWQEAFENTFFDQVLTGIAQRESIENKGRSRFQAVFCIDDRESSLRTYIEQAEPRAQTYGAAGFFNLAVFFRPEHGQFRIKVCPNPLHPEHTIIEKEAKKRHKRETTMRRGNQSMFTGWISAQTLGFWSAMKMTKNIFLPGESPLIVSSFQHMDPIGILKLERFKDEMDGDCKEGFTPDEMVNRMEGLFRSIGLVDNFAPLIYFVGHGASSINNTYYAGYDCGACCGRPGSVNARAAAIISNRADVREGLANRGIIIPKDTQFIGVLHDTTRDEIQCYDEQKLDKKTLKEHKTIESIFHLALQRNAVERARRFDFIDHKKEASQVHKKVKKRAVSLFEPRPEWNHATNALCIVGSRDITRKLFLDRRAFLQSYDYKSDPSGNVLGKILDAITPVCGGINLEYYFSRVDNMRLGAGSKLPHNVMGLIGVANGMEGDLRTGLPYQMVNIHDPLRLMMLIEHDPAAVLNAIQSNPTTYEWYVNEWIVLAVVHPETRELFKFRGGVFVLYESTCKEIPKTASISDLINERAGNIPIHQFI